MYEIDAAVEPLPLLPLNGFLSFDKLRMLKDLGSTSQHCHPFLLVHPKGDSSDKHNHKGGNANDAEKRCVRNPRERLRNERSIETNHRPVHKAEVQVFPAIDGLFEPNRDHS